MPLELGDAEQELQEVREVKQRVREVAKSYTDRHGWCDVVNQALKEAGVAEEDKLLSIDARVSVVGNVRISVPVGELVGKSPEEMNQRVAELLGEQGVFAINRRGPLQGATPEHRNATEQVITWTVEDLEEWTPPPPPRAEVDEFQDRISDLDWNRYGLRFTSMDGRMMHIVQQGRIDRGMSAVCGATRSYGRTNWSRISNRSEHRVCSNCLRNLGLTIRIAGEEG